jgi:Mg2+-importing ATPase
MESSFSHYAQKNTEEVVELLNTSLTNGLSNQEVQTRQKKYGLNIIKEEKIAWYTLLFKQIYSSFFILFFALAVLSFVFGEQLNAVIILAFLAFNAGVGFYQEFQAYKNLELLQKYLVAMVTVLRDGQEVEIPSSELVPGDILVLYPGDIIAGDVRLARASSFEVDESILTGESASVLKNVEPISGVVNELKAQNIGFAGTTVVAGKAFSIVIATAHATVMSGIAQLAESVKHESSLSKGTRELSSFITKLIVVAMAAVFLGNLFFKGFDIDLANLLLFSVAMAITVTPEALPVVITFCLARGVKQLAKRHVLVKRLSAVEDLGAIEILCTDKTGTLTENTLSVGEVYGKDPTKALFYAALTTNYKGKSVSVVKKGFDYVLWSHLPQASQQELLAYEGLVELPFDSARRRNVTVVKGSGGQAELIVRGSAPDVLGLCSIAGDKNELDAWLLQQGGQGNRVLAVALKPIAFTGEKNLDMLQKDMELLGLISFADPIKKSAIESIQYAERLGLEIKVLSGDVPEVCLAVGKQVGLIQGREQIMTGDEFEKIPENQKESVVHKIAVFARVNPAQKFEIVQLLQKKKVVGYMGDGVNDVPALQVADVSIAVQDAVDVAYRAANIIILQKSLHVLCTGVEEGRKVVANTLKYIRTSLGTIWGNFVSLFIASLLIDYLPMLPVQLLLVNLISDFPMIAVSTDSVDKQELRYPKQYHVQDILLICMVLGSVASLADMIFFFLFKNFEPAVLQTGWFVESILTAIVYIFCIRTRGFIFFGTVPSLPLLALALAGSVIGIVLPLLPFGHDFFHLVPLSMHQYALIGGVVFFFFCMTECMKFVVFSMLPGRKVLRHGRARGEG